VTRATNLRIIDSGLCLESGGELLATPGDLLMPDHGHGFRWDLVGYGRFPRVPKP